MKIECHNIALDAILNIRSLEQLIEIRRRAGQYAFDSRLAHITLDSLKKFITEAGRREDLISRQVESFNNHAEGIRGMLPATEYVRPESSAELPTFDDIADVFSQLAIESIVNCECLRKEL